MLLHSARVSAEHVLSELCMIGALGRGSDEAGRRKAWCSVI
jgi:hypothetical protein